jgi:Mycothiol maleylpyruvate isomerase N-terminal domain
VQGDTSAPTGHPVPATFTTASPAERQQMETAVAQSAVALRERLGTELLDVFRTAWTRHNQLIANLKAHEWHTSCYYPLGIKPVRVLVNAAIFELAIHGWDIRSGLEPSARLSPEALAVMPDYFAECLGWFFRPGLRLPTPIRYRFAFTGTLNSQWDMVVAGDTAYLEPAAEATPANVTFGCEVETFTLLLCGRRGLEAAMGARQVISEGDMALVQAFKQWF